MAQIQPSPSADAPDREATFSERVTWYRERVNNELDRWLSPHHVGGGKLLDAMRYAVLGGGKRVRPLFTYASSELVGTRLERADAIAAAVELVHAYSLVHDDLPAMDDDELRRGRPTVHMEFDEATAILVGDALQALAFQVLTDSTRFGSMPVASALLVARLAKAAGANGMVGGQVLDLAYSGQAVNRRELEDMFARKTGRLIAAAIRMPLDCVHATDDEVRKSLNEFAELAGLCFQIHDDVLDVTRDTDQLGKPSGSDVRNDRSAYPARFGLQVARSRADELQREANRYLDALGPNAEGLRWLTNFIVNRNH